MVIAVTDRSFDAGATAAQFVRARLAAAPLATFPGVLPPDLDAAYRCQDAAIALWPDAIAGWKVGWVPEPFASLHGEERLVGPIFAAHLRRAGAAETVSFPVYAGGFAAVEAEFVFRIGQDVPASMRAWQPADAAGVADALFIGVEIASSPLASINDLGAPVIVSDFGNNAGLIVGAEIGSWRERDLASLTCECRIEGRDVGHGGAASLPGGPLAALAFALHRLGRRGRDLRTGDLVTTGAATGVHDIRPGESAEALFPGVGTIRVRAVAAQPRGTGGGASRAHG